MFAVWLLWCNWSHDCLTLLRQWLLLCFLLPSYCCCCCVLSQGIHNNSSSDCTSNAASVDQIVVIFNFLDSASYQAEHWPGTRIQWVEEKQQQEIQPVLSGIEWSGPVQFSTNPFRISDFYAHVVRSSEAVLVSYGWFWSKGIVPLNIPIAYGHFMIRLSLLWTNL